jgi:signal transduction histidine kinase
MRTRRLKPLLLLFGSVAGILALAAWNYYGVRRATVDSNSQWVRRTSEMVTAERESFVQWVDDFPIQSSEQVFTQMPRAKPSVVAIVVTDLEKRRTERWVRSDYRPYLEQIDPRLVVLQLQALQSQKTLMGPVVLLNRRPFWTAIRPIGRQRSVVIFCNADRFWHLLETESRYWKRRCFIYDNSQNLLFASTNSSAIRGRVPGVIDQIRLGKPSGHVPLSKRTDWKWVTTYHHDAASGWIFIVSQSAPWVYAPLLLFFVSLFALVWLARLPTRATEQLHLAGYHRELAQFAQRVERFVRGKEPALKEPPYPFQELMPIVSSLRWLLPQWQRAEAYPRELALERKLLALLIESLPEAILFFNAQGGLQLSNELGRVFFSLQQEAGREYKMMSGIQVPRGFLEGFTEPVFTGVQKNLGKEVEVGWADGKHLYRVWVEAVEEIEGQISGFIVVVRDITFRKQWEYVQEQVLSGITHDLRGPLSAVMGYLDLMRRQVGEAGNPKLLEYLKLAREAGVRLTQMVSDILDVVRFEQGKIELQIEPISVASIFQRLHNIFSVTAEQKKVTLRLEANGAADLNTYGDPKLLERIFDNLVGNAIKFTPSAGTITVTATPAKDRMVFSVADTGRGIPREAQSRIFDKFQQVRPGDRSAGYGLGLAVVKFIIEAHRGEIRVESEVGKGSTFTFWIPNYQPAPQPAGQSAGAPPKTV